MRILTEHNQPIDLTDVTRSSAPACYAMVLDHRDLDFHAIPLVFTEHSPDIIAVVTIAGATFHLPASWSILCVEAGAIEPVPLRHVALHAFDAFTLNPITGRMPSGVPINVGIASTVREIVMPRLSRHQCLAVPLTASSGARCVFVTPDRVELPTMALAAVMGI